MTAPTFIVSTGRCGSTMLSNMVRMHPDLLSVSEFFTSLTSKAFRGKTMTGEAVFQRLNTLSPSGRALLANGLFVEEFLYPLGPDARYRPEEVPPVMCATLPHLTDDHERLWDRLAGALRSRGEASLAAHYRFTFEWLAERFGKKAWVERSGASLLFVPELDRLFAGARFVHVHRDGRDTAMSMHKHHFFRLRIQAAEVMRKVGLDPFHPANWLGTSPWMPFFERWRFRFFSADRYRRTRIRLTSAGWFWSRMIERGSAYLEALPRDRVLALRFESILESPKKEMSRFIDFVGPEFSDARWLEEIRALPRRRPPNRARLSPEEHARLAAACKPGQDILNYDNAPEARSTPWTGSGPARATLAE